MPKRIAVIGAGVGGLATAARLAHDGYEVDVFEKLPELGGRCHLLEAQGFRFDMGPSFVLMPDFFEEVFAYCGEKIGDYLDLKVLETSYKVFYSDGTAVTVFCDSARTKEEIERIEPGSAKAFDAFIEDITSLYRKIRPFLFRNFTLRDMANPRYWVLLKDLKVFESYWGLASRYFKSEKLRYLFTFEAMFMGVSPFKAPALYSIISYTDHVQKIFHPMGGMYRIPLALEHIGRKSGARYHYNSQVKSIEQKEGASILAINGRQFVADTIVVNADYAYAKTDLLKDPIPDYAYSCSVYLLYWGISTKVPGLEHHNLFLGRDLKSNLDDIFRSGAYSPDPSFYIHVPTKTDPSLAPPGKEILYVLVPVPNLKTSREDISAHEERIRNLVLEKVKSVTGMDIRDKIEVENRFYPKDFTGRYNIKFGATFGLAHTLKQSAFFRPGVIDPGRTRTFYVGASTQPGGGLPVVLAGSRIAADSINALDHRGSR